MKRRIRLLRLRPRELSNSCLSDDKSHLGLIPRKKKPSFFFSNHLGLYLGCLCVILPLNYWKMIFSFLEANKIIVEIQLC